MTDNTIVGIPAQTIMDMFMLLSSGEEPLEVVHCKGITHIAFNLYNESGGFERGLPCVPVNKDKYPNWKCARDGFGFDASDHHFCLADNDPTVKHTKNKAVWFCTCNQGPQYTPLQSLPPSYIKQKIGGVRNYFLVVGSDLEDYSCPGCRNGHKSKGRS